MATVSKFQYKAPVLTETEFRINREYVKQKGPIPINIHLQREVTPLENANKAIIELTVYLNGNETKWDDDAPYWAKVKYGAQFEWDDNVTEEDIEKFLRTNAPALLIGYIRPVIAQLTAMSPFPVYTLPLIDTTGDW